MIGSPDPARLAAWHESALPEKELAAALLCDVEDVRAVLASSGFRYGSAEERSPTHITPRHRVGLAISHALHRQAGLPLAAAANVVSGAWRVCDSVLATLDFFPAADGQRARESGQRPSCDERDPFLLFAPYAVEAMAIPAIDEFLDVADGRRIFWRRPQRDAHRLACELHRLSETSAREDTPALQEEFLEVLCQLREPADHVAEWIGTVVDGHFRPRPDRFADETPFLRQGFDLAGDPARFAEAYGTRISVNVSLAARSMKRRMLGLDVTRPGDGPDAERYRPRTVKRMPLT